MIIGIKSNPTAVSVFLLYVSLHTLTWFVPSAKWMNDKDINFYSFVGSSFHCCYTCKHVPICQLLHSVFMPTVFWLDSFSYIFIWQKMSVLIDSWHKYFLRARNKMEYNLQQLQIKYRMYTLLMDMELWRMTIVSFL